MVNPAGRAAVSHKRAMPTMSCLRNISISFRLDSSFSFVPHFAKMRAFTCLGLLFAASLSQALQSPHEKVKHVKRSARPVAPRAELTSMFLTNTTSSKPIMIQCLGSTLIVSQNLQSTAVLCQMSISTSANRTPEHYQSLQIQTISIHCGSGSSLRPIPPRRKKS